MQPRVWSFEEGDGDDRALLGGKGAGLCEMTRTGLPVPPGFIIPTTVCKSFYESGGKLPDGLREEVMKKLGDVESRQSRRLGDASAPLLVSVRSGARASMPGMMDTVLNIGLNERTVEGLARLSGSARFAWDSYRRLIQMFADVVMGVRSLKDGIDPFENALESMKKKRKAKSDADLGIEDLRALVAEFKGIVKKRSGREFPEEAHSQLFEAISAVFRSWENDRAKAYRRLNKIPDDWGTAVTVQAMVFGNLGDDSGTGVAFTRNPATGEKRFFGEFLVNAQGEDVVAGVRTPQSMDSLKKLMPDVFEQLMKMRETLEKQYRDMQDIEFTVERGRLYMLQTRAGKRSGIASVRIAVDMVDEALISEEEALMRVEPEQLNHVLRPIFDWSEKQKAKRDGRLLAKGLNAGPGAANGIAVFHPERAEALARKRKRVILVRSETSPEDIRGMAASEGILTARGGMTSHAALVGRQMGKVCVVGCGALAIDYPRKRMQVGGRTVKEGDHISIDGTTGEVFSGEILTKSSEVISVLVEKSMTAAESPLCQAFTRLLSWADRERRLKVRANADTPEQARLAVMLGAEGIGLCRTEHMFFEGERITAMREMILADDETARRKALDKLLPMQRSDFVGIFEAMGERPVTIRTLDPPLHEFLTVDGKGLKRQAAKMGVSQKKLKERVDAHREANPMLGHRGCRLGVSHPEITEMQARAIIEAVATLRKRGKKAVAEIMVPLVGDPKELSHQRRIIEGIARDVAEREGVRLDHSIGTMIEVPRACIVADEIAREAEFFSFGTNDLTQMTMGVSRDDSANFLPLYVERGFYPDDPFASIDRRGVGQMMKMAVTKGRAVRKDLKIGICGEHGGDPKSVEFCHEIGLDYVSCSPYRIPVARLAAARAAIQERGGPRPPTPARGGMRPEMAAMPAA